MYTKYEVNEAHRFGINHHRNKRSKGALQTELTQIPGVGDKTVVSLLKKFKSLKRIKNAVFAQDYADVMAVLAQWRLSEDPTASSRIIEYRMIQEELEAEIEQLLLDAVKSASPQ